MKEKEQKLIANPVGVAALGDPHFEEPTQNKKSPKACSNLTSKEGITLIALVITIIIMLILVGVTITVALKGGLFSTAKEAKSDTQGAINVEQTLANGKIKVDGKWYNSIDDYLEGKPLPPTYEEAIEGKEFLEENATLTEGDYTAVVPKGFKISEEEGEGSIETGLVIQDAKGNEFVWIPVTSNLEYSYSLNNNSNYKEPCELSDVYSESGFPFDSQETLTYLYGDIYNYSDFKYEDEYKEMVDSVNENDGFYIGRYETTIDDDGSIGSKENKTVLLAKAKLKNGINPNNSESYYYRWYGLYAEQKKADVTGNGENIQTSMLYGVLWYKAMQFIKINDDVYDLNNPTSSWHPGTSLAKSGQLNPGEHGDVALNIWDLESNALEWTQEACYTDGRTWHGGDV